MAYDPGYYGSQWRPPPGPQWPPPPVSAAASGTAYLWFKIYVGVMVAIYALCMAGGAFFFLADIGTTPQEVDDLRITGAIYGIAGLIGLAVFAPGLFLPRRPWAWIYGIVLIGLGMTSCCIVPAAIPLLIAWLKPEMKARFNRS